jgi:hypothetical protein
MIVAIQEEQAKALYIKHALSFSKASLVVEFEQSCLQLAVS